MVTGALSIIWGLTAAFRPEFFSGTVLFANLNFWGITWLILGPVEIVAGVSVVLKAQWARIFTIIIASIGLVWNFMGMDTHPLWSATVMLLHVLVIYGLVVHGKPYVPSAIELAREAEALGHDEEPE